MTAFQCLAGPHHQLPRGSKLAGLFCCILVMVIPPLAAQSVSQEIIPLSSTVYADMDDLYLLTGRGTPSHARPWTKGEAVRILERIDQATLTANNARNNGGNGGAATALYDVIAAAIQPGLRFGLRDGFSLGVAVDLNLEAYAHSNQDFDRETDWVQGFETRRPLGRLSLEFSLDDFLYIHSDLQYGRNRFNYLDDFIQLPADHPGIGAVVPNGMTPVILSDGSPIYRAAFLTNILDYSYNFDFQWPKRAVVSVGGPRWNISLGRDKLAWGNGRSGNFIIDSHVDYHEFVRLVAFSDLFKYDWLNVFFEANPTQHEISDSEFRILMAHRLEFRIFERLTFAISENIMYRNDIFDARYLNPAFIYHNLNNRDMFNAIGHIELDWNITSGLGVYAQYVLDQARAPNEGTSQSDIMGLLAGIEYSQAAGPGILSASLEGAITDPLLYRRDKVDFIMFRRYFTHGDPYGPSYVLALDYIGYQYGGDAQVLQFDAGYRLPGMGRLGLRLFAMRRGEMDFFTSHNLGGNNDGPANYEGKTPSGDRISESLIASLWAEYQLPRLLPWQAAGIWARMDWSGRRTWNKSSAVYEQAAADLQFSAGITLSL
jgi:hypothetical protein